MTIMITTGLIIRKRRERTEKEMKKRVEKKN